MRFFSVSAILLCWSVQAQTLDINGYSTIVISPVDRDTYGVMAALGDAARDAGFKVLDRPESVTEEDLGRSLALGASWEGTALGVNMSVAVYDLITGRQVAASTRELLQWGGARGLVRRGTRTVFGDLRYGGYDQRAHDENLRTQNLISNDAERFSMTEADLVRYLDENRTSLDVLEGIWTSVSTGNDNNHYKIGIVRTPGSATRAFTAFVLQSNIPWWRMGDIKARLEGTAGEGIYTAAFYLADRSLQRVPFTVKEGALLESVGGAVPVGFVKNYPGFTATPTSTTAGVTPVASGTGFVVGQNVVVTNHHVIESGNRFEFITESAGTFPLEVLAADKANDVVVLRLMPTAQGKYPSFRALPLAPSPARLGEDVYAIGYPLTDILGGAIRVTDGSVSALQGIDSDPRYYQVSVPTQPGNSGGPVLNARGEVVGILTAQLNALGVARVTGSVPQNINFAIKMDYVLPLVPADRRSIGSNVLAIDRNSDRAEQVGVLQQSVGVVKVHR